MNPPNWLSYAWGNCTRWVAENLPWIPAYLGNAKDWAANAQKQGYPISHVPVVGSAVVYGAGNGYNPTYGHVADVIGVDPGGQGFTVTEENVKGLGVVDTRHSTMGDVLGFILPKGSTVPTSASGSPPPVGGQGGVDLNPLDIPKGIWDHILQPIGDALGGLVTGVEHLVVANVIGLVVGVVIVLIVFSPSELAPQAAPAPAPAPAPRPVPVPV